MCIALLLLVNNLCLKVGAVVVTGDFNKVVECEALSGDCGDRRISPLEAAFTYACGPWPTSGVTPVWGPGGEPHGNQWPECCGFVMLPESQIQWLIMRHGSFDVKPAAIGLKPTDQTWHYEQWLHFKFACRKRRRDAHPAVSNSRRRNKYIPSYHV